MLSLLHMTSPLKLLLVGTLSVGHTLTSSRTMQDLNTPALSVRTQRSYPKPPGRKKVLVARETRVKVSKSAFLWHTRQKQAFPWSSALNYLAALPKVN